MNSWRDALPKLNEGLKRPSFVVDSPGYEVEVAGFNEAVVHQPAAVVGAETTADVRASVEFASRHRLDVAVINTGHGPSVPGGPNTLMITTRRMAEVSIDADNKMACVEAGYGSGS